MLRRNFLFAATAAVAPSWSARLPIQKGVFSDMLPKSLSWTDRFKLARDVGFEIVECPTAVDQAEAEEIKKASDTAKLPVHSVMNASHGKYPLSSDDPAIVASGLQGLETSLNNAKLWGADTVLLVPAFVTPRVRYQDAWTRSQSEIRRILPKAADMKIVIAIENVGNRFLLSPLEFARYVDEMNSPWLKAYFDVGNIVRNGYPQDWIRTLGKRIVKLHLKDPSTKEIRQPGQPSRRAPLLEGDVDWREVHKALTEIGYIGAATVELPAGDEAYLRDVVRRVDIILSGGVT
jgi:L-ribulose-5-phosphate 3-epimerase